MKITIVSIWYNEAFLAPFFLNHYNYVDKIHIFLDTDTNDKTREICKQYSNIEIEEFAFPQHIFDGKIKTQKINRFVSALESDWVYVLDPDEFIFPENNESARAVLARQTANMLYARMWQSWRHETETDLDSSKPSIYQRRHGSLFYRHGQKLFNKPIIVKPETGIQWKEGAHSYYENKKIIESEENFMGSHWKYADIDMAITRRTERFERFKGQQNVDRDLVIKKIRKQEKEHLTDARLL